MIAYPQIWKLFQSNISDRLIEGKLPSTTDVREFLSKLNECHAEFSAFFSQPVYEKFFQLRDGLMKLHGRVDEDHPVTWTDAEELERLWSGDTRANTPGFATKLKDDLGRYEVTAFQISGSR